MAHTGRGRSYGRQKRLPRVGARLGREEQGREAVLGYNGDIPQRASKHGRAERLLRRRVLLQERQHLRPDPASSFHHKGDQLRVRVYRFRFASARSLAALPAVRAARSVLPASNVHVL